MAFSFSSIRVHCWSQKKKVIHSVTFVSHRERTYKLRTCGLSELVLVQIMQKFYPLRGQLYLYSMPPVSAAKQVIEIIRLLILRQEAVYLFEHKGD
jgi:hypothetical protein